MVVSQEGHIGADGHPVVARIGIVAVSDVGNVVEGCRRLFGSGHGDYDLAAAARRDQIEADIDQIPGPADGARPQAGADIDGADGHLIGQLVCDHDLWGAVGGVVVGQGDHIIECRSRINLRNRDSSDAGLLIDAEVCLGAWALQRC